MTLQTITLARISLLAGNAFFAGINFVSLVAETGNPIANHIAVLGGFMGVIVGGNMILQQTLANGESQEKSK